jgi:large subunit ribosomal protein L3
MAEKQTTDQTSANLNTFVGVKAGMTRVFDKDGNHVPVTVVKLIPNIVSQVKTASKEGYDAYQIAYYEKKAHKLGAPVKGHLKKANISNNLTRFFEIKVPEAKAELVGKEIEYTSFDPDTYVDVTGQSKGKGFQGVIKRFNFSGGPAAHGSHFHRTPGSIGMCDKPGKVFKNTKLPGQMGNKRVTVQNIKLIEINTEDGYALLKGSIPGSKNGVIRISKAVKK